MDITVHESHRWISLDYPERPVEMLRVCLCDVRASEPIQIGYDFDRDGWVIQEQTSLSTETGEETWKEVCFIESKDWNEDGSFPIAAVPPSTS